MILGIGANTDDPKVLRLDAMLSRHWGKGVSMAYFLVQKIG
jgi:hypothetical protein